MAKNAGCIAERCRQVEINLGVRAVDAGTERQSLKVIPVEVCEQQHTTKRRGADDARNKLHDDDSDSYDTLELETRALK